MPSAERSLLDRVFKRAVPRPVATYTPPPQELTDGLWILERRLRHVRVAILPSLTTIVRLRDGSLAVIAPPALADTNTRAAIDRVGPVKYLVIPNSFHYLYASEFMGHYPAATLLAAPGLLQRVPGLAVDAELDHRHPPPETWSGVLEHLVLGPVRGLSELLFFHRPTATLILTDVAFNMTRYPRLLDRVFWRLSGIPRGFGPSRTSRSLLLRDRAAASRTLARAMEWPFSRIVVAHGEVVDRDARSRAQRAFARYLPGG